MLSLILLLVISSALVYLSKFNFGLVDLNLGFYAFADIPLFYVIVGSLLVGLVLSYLIYLVQAFATALTLRDKNQKIKKGKDELLDLTRRVHQLELENSKLKQLTGNEPDDNNAL